MRWEAWPALLATMAWAWFLVALGSAWRPVGPAGWLAPLLVAGLPLVVSTWALVADRRPSTSAGVGTRPPAAAPESSLLLSSSAAGLLGLVLGASAIELIAAPMSFMVGLETPIAVTPLLPGPSEAWAYLVSLVLTIGAVSRTWRRGLVVAGILVAGALAGGTVLAWGATGAVPTLATWAEGSCQYDPNVPATSLRSIAAGDLDGTSLGRVDVHLQAERSDVLVVTYDTRWGNGISLLVVPGRPVRDPLEEVTLGRRARLAVDDLGAEMVDGRAARHCRLQVDGPAAVAGFPALRWLVGQNEDTTDPGKGLEAWRGTVDYWLVTTTESRIQAVDIVLATVTVDGQPPGWPFPGLHARLRATSWFGGP